MIKRLLEKLNLIKTQKPKLVISDIISCSCSNGIIVCPACNGEQSRFGICAGCKGTGIRTCGKCGGIKNVLPKQKSLIVALMLNLGWSAPFLAIHY
jgi:hypothetical protein